MAARYQIIARELENELRSMQQTGSGKLASEAELCRRFDCSRQTIRSALAVLEQKGLIIKKRGSGSFPARMPSSISREVFVIVPDRNEYIYPSIIRDIQSALEPKGYTLRCCSTDSRIMPERDALAQAAEALPAGIIMQASNAVLCEQSSGLLRQLREAGVPLVYLFDSYEFPSQAPCITQDNYGGAYQLVEYLASKGHRRIAAIMKSDSKSGVERYRGCMQACIELGLDFDEKQFFWFSSEDRRNILNGNDRVLRGFISDCLKPCTAVVCYNDEIAFHLIACLEAAGLEIPRQTAVVSFDNSYYTRSGTIGITSLGHTPGALGGGAAEALLTLIAGKAYRPALVPWELHERQSS